MKPRTLLGTAGWIGAAVLAVLIGLAAVRVIGDGLSSEAGRPRSQAEVDRDLAAHATTMPASAPPSVEATPSAAASTSASASAGSGSAPSAGLRSFRTAGGTVVARCAAGRAEIVAMSPLGGFAVHERDQGPRVQAEGEFRGTVDDHDRVKVRVGCAGDRPVLDERDDD
ncbi:hypothetical protein ACFQFC_09465 [Amorphoplanes digitatis]|uniref:Septum formation initiator n=1 Tax=Actinoplanes digitatis TaxID=1868 RepID=A0A7W7MS91_9ACTN|nr:hypothetical protein [Actinoplanes digitatis]MBB4764420.1 hypothetical protein [Actinoplanes digitatis]BFE73854.1 hypothetical protein GCM10020092_071550 [Actinoplanes digitatis]GID94093.1 hypothetical protein Adi01nite_35050 [Actinoplanes digitatis]